ncbi:hypothetical protein J7444_07990 [Labrenzia sp. R4_1]|uniref:hypothetical protein n=1 Tax=Labrenzia sp. R4_1 TaxID=2821106 RepID=UPI001AD9FE6D|nr:hypothetical protein [Labrenzia sp. R4_1]MBO9424657.1 hypothetical protein [Labrenzia sp. R4_1]
MRKRTLRLIAMQQRIDGYWRIDTRVGEFSIRFHDGYWAPFFEDEHLGAYHSPLIALEELVGGSTFMPSNGVWPADLDLPDDFSDWQFVRFNSPV